MKAKLFGLLLVTILVTMNSCSSDSSDDSTTTAPQAMSYTYNENELETMRVINEYRVSIGLNELKEINHISYKSEEHDEYMIEKNDVNHDDFVSRSENIKRVLGAKSVSENVAYDFNTPKGVLDAWLRSPSHRKTIEGDFTNFGLSIRVDANGKKYYTNIFVKL